MCVALVIDKDEIDDEKGGATIKLRVICTTCDDSLASRVGETAEVVCLNLWAHRSIEEGCTMQVACPPGGTPVAQGGLRLHVANRAFQLFMLTSLEA